MKKFMVLALAIASATSLTLRRAQQPSSTDFKVDAGLFVFEKVDLVELSKREIIAYTAAFFAEKFKSSKSVIELRDDDLGKIVGDVVLQNLDAGFLDGFKAIKAR